MGERKGTNKWIPPDFDPALHGTLNKYHGSHPLGDRARKINEGITIVRFEMPFNAWCTHCNSHIGKGVRYNAEKSCVGKYFSTRIFRFSMKDTNCGGEMIIETDPQNSDFKLVSGVKKKTDTWDADDSEVQALLDSKEKERLERDPFFRLEHGFDDTSRVKGSKPVLQQLQEVMTSRAADDVILNRLVRKRFREDKKSTAAAAAAEAALSARLHVSIPVVAEDESDVAAAAAAFAIEADRGARGQGLKRDAFKDSKRQARANVLTRPILPASKSRLEERQRILNAIKTKHKTGMSSSNISKFF